MKTFLLAAALSLAVPSALQAAEPAPKAAKRETRKRKGSQTARPKTGPVRPVNITAQVFEVQPNSERAVWKGSVVVERDDLKITCDTLTAEYDKAKSLRRLICDGSAYLFQKADPPRHEEREAWGEQAIFDNADAVLIVTGSPRAREGSTRMRGEKVSFFVDENRLRVDKPVIEAETAGAGLKLPGESGK